MGNRGNGRHGSFGQPPNRRYPPQHAKNAGCSIAFTIIVAILIATPGLVILMWSLAAPVI